MFTITWSHLVFGVRSVVSTGTPLGINHSAWGTLKVKIFGKGLWRGIIVDASVIGIGVEIGFAVFWAEVCQLSGLWLILIHYSTKGRFVKSNMN